MNQNFCSGLLKHSFLNFQKLFHNSGAYLANHYETLQLQRNCTSKEIRESFLKLSKENHPDVNKDPKAHKDFLKIQEAYNILNKSASRTNYDLSLSNPNYTHEKDWTNVRSTHSRGYEARHRYGDDPFFYHNRSRYRTSNKEHPYYGIKGVNKVSNGLVAFIVVLLTFAWCFGQMITINYSFQLQRDRMLRRSGETQEILNKVRQRADLNGNELQVDIMRRNFEEADRQRDKLRETLE